MPPRRRTGNIMETIDCGDRTIPFFVRRLARETPQQPVLHVAGHAITCAQLDDATSQFANFMISLGLEPGEKAAIMMPNCAEFVVAWFGISKAGGVYVPINTEYRGAILQYQLLKADVACVVVDAEYLHCIEEVAAELPLLRQVIVHGPCGASVAGLPARSFFEAKSFPVTDPRIALKHSDPHAISYTSGTTGPSKGVLASHSHVITFALDWIRCCEFTREDRLYTGMPLFHALGAWLGVLTTVMAGAQMLLVPRFSASRYWDDVREFDATIGHGIFSVVPILLKQPERPDDRQHRMTRFYLGQENRAFEERFGCRVIEPYGQTETGFLTYTPLQEQRRPGSCGRTNALNFEVKIVDGNDEDCAPGVVGEVVARPTHPYAMMSEYHNDKAATVEAFRNLWFHTGDFARRDEDGYFYYVDRKKDAIRRRGQNISSFELEYAMNQHPKVLESAALAVPSAMGEDEVMLVVVPRDGQSLDPQELWSYCDGRMPKFWCPRFLEIRAEMPKTPTQKIQKYLLRQDRADAVIHDREAKMRE